MLQCTMVHTDPASASQDAVVTGDSPSGEIPETTEERAVVTGDAPSGEIPETTEQPAVGDLPPGEMPMADETAEVPEYLPPGKKSRTEAKEEDVGMEAPEEQHQEEPPPDDPMNATDDAPDFGEIDINDEYSETESVMMRRANELLNSEVYQHFADEENIEGEPSNLEQRPRMAQPAMARSIHNVSGIDVTMMDSLLQADRERSNDDMKKPSLL